MVSTDFLHAITHLRYGDHLCCFYDTAAEHRAVLLPFLRQGLDRGEKVLSIVDLRTAEAVQAYLQEAGLDVESHLASGQLRLLTTDVAFMREGAFNPEGLLALLEGETRQALAEGYAALRVTGEMAWILRGLPDSRHLIEHETHLHVFLQDNKCLALFQYDRQEFDPAVLLDVLRTHPITIVGTLVHENHYYVPPAEFLEEDLSAVSSTAAVALENTRLYTQAKRRMRELEALYQADEEIYRYLHVDQVLQALVDVAVEILQADKSSLMVWDPQEERLTVRAARGFSPETMAQMSFAPGEGVSGHVIATGEPMVVEDTRNDARVAQHITEPEAIRSLMHVPIKIGDEVFGVFNVNWVQPRAFSNYDRRLFLALARRAARAIENAHLYDQAEELARLRERQRIAETWHDTVAQMLFSIGLEARWCVNHLSLESEAHQRLQAIRRLAARGSDELRSAIFTLRSPYLATSEDLVDLLGQQIDEFQAQSGISATLIAPTPLPALPQPACEAIFRIVRESLSNVRKHAQASAVVVSLHANAQEVTVAIQDNGVGLADRTALEGGNQLLHFGVATMHQVAEQAQGELLIANSEDRGVVVKARFPLPEREVP